MKGQPRFCAQCGTQVPPESRFCSQCGSPASQAEPDQGAKDKGSKAPEGAGNLSWEFNIPLLTDQFIMYDLLKVWGISSLGLFLLVAGMAIYDRNWQVLIGMGHLLGLVSLGVLILFILVMLVFFGNRFPMRFVLGPQGAMATSLSQRGRWGNRLAVVLGGLAGKPGVAGAGLLAMSRETVAVDWDEVRRLKIHPRTRVISLMDSWHVALRIYCTPENYNQVLPAVEKWAAKGLKKAAEAPRSRGFSPGLRLGLKSLLAAAAAFLITALPLETPPVLIWLLLAAGLWAIWFVVFGRFFGLVALGLVGLILLGFIGQGLEVQQTTDPDDFRQFALSQGIQVDKVPDWIIGKYRRYEHFHTNDLLQTGIAALGLSFFVWVGLTAFKPRRRKSDQADYTPPQGLRGDGK